MSYTRRGHKPQIHPISCPSVREIQLNSLKEILPDISGCGTHSLKRGAVSTAMSSGTVTSHEIYKCPDFKRLYIQPDLNSKLAVTRSLICSEGALCTNDMYLCTNDIVSYGTKLNRKVYSFRKLQTGRGGVV